MQEFANFILISGIAINVLILFLLQKRMGENSKRLLFAFFCFTLCVSVHFYAEIHEFLIPYLVTFIPTDLIEWVLGPILYFYVRSIFQDQRAGRGGVVVHFIPAIFVFLLLTLPIFISILLNEILFGYLEFMMENERLYVFVRDGYLIIYMLLTYHMLQRFLGKLKAYYSTNREQEVRWIRYLLLGALFISAVDLFSELYEMVMGQVGWNTGYISVALMVLWVIYLGYHGVSQSSVLLPDFIWEEEEPVATEAVPRTAEASDPGLEGKLQELMTTEQPYLDPTLTLGQLSQLLGTSDKRLSALLNQQMKIGFYDYVNEHRIRHFIALLNPENLRKYTLLSLAEQSGFKSKATFNRVFKKHFQTTPSAYLAQNGSHEKQ